MSQLQRLAWRTRNWSPGEGRWEVRVRSGREGKTAPGRGAGGLQLREETSHLPSHLQAYQPAPPGLLLLPAQRPGATGSERGRLMPKVSSQQAGSAPGGFGSHTRPAQCTGGGGQGGAPAVWAWSLRYGAGGPFLWPGCGGGEGSAGHGFPRGILLRAVVVGGGLVFGEAENGLVRGRVEGMAPGAGSGVSSSLWGRWPESGTWVLAGEGGAVSAP